MFARGRLGRELVRRRAIVSGAGIMMEEVVGVRFGWASEGARSGSALQWNWANYALMLFTR